MDSVKWGIIGCGNVTEVKSGPAFQKATNSELVAVMRRNGELAKDYAKRHNVPKWYDHADKLINDNDVNAVYIATPPSTHKYYTLKVAQAGKPVYVEKPMAMNYAECEEMINACEKADVPLFVAYYRRSLPRFLKVKSIIEDNQLGKVLFVDVKLYRQPTSFDKDPQNWRVIPEIAGCGYFCDLASHTLDLLQYYFDKITVAKGLFKNQSGRYKAEDFVSAVFEFKSGVEGTGSWCFNALKNEDKVEIIGTRGKITFSTFSNEPVVLITENGTKTFMIQHPPHIQQPLIQNIVDELLGNGKSPSTGETAAATNWVIDKILNRI
ncbi:Gfo/Idh/MocA family protein [Melioribacteraceae bacterium 4301-Me]|uniref:Gfo/Idh/MocA family protein n=1 Tax=Pyranulibacter aquaticus TaxID=3163344 RepID=UPI00359BFFE3